MAFLTKSLQRASLLRNAVQNLVSPARVYYVAESAAWSIRHDGSMITQELTIPSRLCFTDKGIRNGVVHFGSIHTFCDSKGRIRVPHPSNKTVVTWFHISTDDPRTGMIAELDRTVDRWHTSCLLTRQKLIEFGIPEEKLFVIPLGVDLRAFSAISHPEEKATLRRNLGIPEDSIVVGSFQKDGVGFGEGNTPKLIKGPDIFCDVMELLAKEIPLHVLLTGPARGYVKQRLAKAGITYTHHYVDHPNDLAPYYRTLDAYLISSRAEGGPKAVLEAGACGIPVVSTPVGMAPEVIDDGYNGFVTNPDDLANKLLLVLSDKGLHKKICEQAPRAVANNSWQAVAQRYAEELYLPLVGP